MEFDVAKEVRVDADAGVAVSMDYDSVSCCQGWAG